MSINVNITFGEVFSSDTSAALEFVFDDDAPSNKTHALHMKATQQWTRTASVAVPKAKLWSPDAPHLHTLTGRLLDADGTPNDAIGISSIILSAGASPTLSTCPMTRRARARPPSQHTQRYTLMW